MMDLPRPRLIFRLTRKQLRRLIDDAEKDIYADGKIRAPYRARVTRFHYAPHAIDLVVPAGRTDDRVHAEFRDALDVADYCSGRGEFDRDIDALEILRRDAFEADVIEFVKFERNFDAARCGERLNHPAHFAVADNRDFHSKTSGSSSLKNSLWSASTARRRS